MAPITGIAVGVCEGKQVGATCFETVAANSGEGSLIIPSVLDRAPEYEFRIIVAVLPGRVDGIANGKGQAWPGSRRVQEEVLARNNGDREKRQQNR
jgi:hypothetical protein